ncbi:hypothetical protein [Polyangium jinanense]|uniref:Lipoprotein n=1 Tax=Polyangium jinanense TaxID=2829994 RepID=A0A9X3XFF4_9BACT|nr:hypothetical protein [Polyangium jinanense]MDC3961344.1 hypothetical protein [Polyangium jinanense]MDC3987723.1 hypothetical protein [Polyangium jinanense]
MHKIDLLVPVAALLLSACGKSSDPAPAPAGSAAPAATSAAAPAPTASAAAAAPVETSAYSIVLEAPDGVEITPLQGGAVLSVSNLYLPLGEGPLVQDPAFMKGLKKGEVSYVVGGEWPKSAWIMALSAENKPKAYKWFDSLGGRWEPQTILREDEDVLDVAVIGESVVAAIKMPSNDIRFALVGGKGGVIPAPFPSQKAAAKAESGEEGAGDTPPEDDKSCKVKMAPEPTYTLAGTPTGEAFAAGFECQDAGGKGAPMAERWEPKKARGTVDPLPAPSGELTIADVVAVSATDAWVYGNAGDAPYLAHWDGKAWALEKAPSAKKIHRIVAIDGGTLLASFGDGLYTKKAGGAWELVAMPKKLENFEPLYVYARTTSDVWVAGRAGGKGYLLRSAKVDKPMTMPSDKEAEDTLKSNFRYLATPLCVKPYAHLFSIGPSAAPIPKEFPAVKKSFEGKKFDGAKLVVEDDGRSLFVGAKAANIEQAEAIVKAFAEANPKMTPRVFCHEPQVKKDVDWP